MMLMTMITHRSLKLTNVNHYPGTGIILSQRPLGLINSFKSVIVIAYKG
jgi:hypothetical protein